MKSSDIEIILREVREILFNGGGNKLGLSTNYDIIATEEEIGGHGLTELFQEKNKQPIVLKVVIGLKSPSDTTIQIETLLLSFIHELAHTITELSEMETTSVSKKVLRLQPGSTAGGCKNVIVHHSSLFYCNYASLLRIAEENSVLTIPSVRGKLSTRNLMLLDSIDPSASASGLLIGFSPRYSSQRDHVRMLLLTEGGDQKLYLADIKNISLKSLLKTASTKFNRRGKKSFVSFTLCWEDNKIKSSEFKNDDSLRAAASSAAMNSSQEVLIYLHTTM